MSRKAVGPENGTDYIDMEKQKNFGAKMGKHKVMPEPRGYLPVHSIPYPASLYVNQSLPSNPLPDDTCMIQDPNHPSSPCTSDDTADKPFPCQVPTSPLATIARGRMYSPKQVAVISPTCPPRAVAKLGPSKPNKSSYVPFLDLPVGGLSSKYKFGSPQQNPVPVAKSSSLSSIPTVAHDKHFEKKGENKNYLENSDLALITGNKPGSFPSQQPNFSFVSSKPVDSHKQEPSQNFPDGIPEYLELTSEKLIIRVPKTSNAGNTAAQTCPKTISSGIGELNKVILEDFTSKKQIPKYGGTRNEGNRVGKRKMKPLIQDFSQRYQKGKFAREMGDERKEGMKTEAKSSLDSTSSKLEKDCAVKDTTSSPVVCVSNEGKEKDRKMTEKRELPPVPQE